ncbi:hypothetical protein L5515_010805 [Caenorhabditis briggsae]|uniref:Uncharacterized protein n=1 Tax=Caenorhabditis briggsae TaxID=6238 RepID=A0AAE9EN39_CAEBR|nr:hypothetical protein L3Y34_003655 [Caenorhabditis briggsae]UMM27557.1 hypothetical protein L5515_010805 [Caenorhabditis briggsae]
MSVTSFLRRFSIDVENTGGSSSSSAPGSASSSGPTKRRGRIAASIDSARRRFSLQHGSGTCRDQDPVHLQSIALRGRGKGENGSLPDLMEKRETPPATNNTGATTTKRVSVIATDRDRAYFLRQKNMRNNKNSAEKI